MSDAALTILMFSGLLIGLFMGHPLAFVLGGLAVIFGYFGWGPSVFYMFMNRIYGVMDNYELIAVPLFILMAQLLDKSGVADDLFEALRYLLGSMRGGVLYAVIVVCTVFAACTGIVGASIVTMGLVALPVLVRYGYDKEMSTGAIAAGGTLGILIPPSIMLVVMGAQATISVGKLFAAAVIPGLILAGLYLSYIFVACTIKPERGPTLSKEELAEYPMSRILFMCLKSLVPPVVLILGVLGSLFAGIATPTEASGVGCFIAFLLVLAYRKFTWKGLAQAAFNCAKVTLMVVMILVGATCFTGVFLGVGGGDVVTDFVLGLGLGKWGIFAIMMIIVVVLGMFLDWLGIVLICFPIFIPIAEQVGFDKLWFVTMIAIVLQTSFLTPPFGYALFYLSGIAPEGVTMSHIYRGIVPFVILMIIGTIICTVFPQTILWLPSVAVK
jgi:tripartite ATP-independent transporter DctM subunit